jgi:hypothetical protein
VVERRKQIEIETQEIVRKEKELISTIKLPAEAEAYKVQAIAEGNRYESQTVTHCKKGQRFSRPQPGCHYNQTQRGIFLDIFFFVYDIEHCFICRPSDSIVSEDARIEPRTVAITILAVRRSNLAGNNLIIPG